MILELSRQVDIGQGRVRMFPGGGPYMWKMTDPPEKVAKASAPPP